MNMPIFHPFHMMTDCTSLPEPVSYYSGVFVHLSHMSAFCSTLYMFRLVDKTVTLMQKTCAGISFFHPEQQN